MKIQLGFLSLTASLAVLAFKCGLAAESTLRFISILHRHGNRAPVDTYPLDPYKNDSLYWHNGREELLNVGKVNLFEQGKFLRQRYDGFLPAKYHSTKVLARATPKNRTIASDQMLLAGLFPPVDDQVWNPQLLWQPIPVLATDRATDAMLCVTKPCPLFASEMEKFNSGNGLKGVKDSKSAVMDLFRKHTGLAFAENWLLDLVAVEDNLLLQQEQGWKLPDWAKDVHPENMASLLDYMTAMKKNSKTVVKLVSGVLINDIMSEMLKKREQKDAYTRLLNLYSGHDLTIQNLWHGMGITNEMFRPGYGALFIIELHEVKGKYRVKVVYKHSATEKNLQVLNVKGCEADQERNRDGMCDLDVLNSVLESVKITDFDKECNSPSGPATASAFPQC